MAHFKTTRRVEFYDTDMAGIVHFASFFCFMEAAEHELFRSLGLKIVGELPDGTSYGWPRVSATCSYKSPAHYEDVLDIHVRIVRRGERSLTTAYQFYRNDLLLAEGELKTVFCLIPKGDKMHSAVMVPEIASPLDRAMEERMKGEG